MGPSTNQIPPGHVPPLRNKGEKKKPALLRMVFIRPDHKAGYFWEGYVIAGGWLAPGLASERCAQHRVAVEAGDGMDGRMIG